jgi:putative nucleotidyltransferase with HDIG domain
MKLAEQLEIIIRNRIEKDNLTLPSIPATALKAIELTRNPDFNMQEVANLVQKDPVLAAQVLKLTNSAAMATREPCKSISQAVTRLGAQKLRTVLIEASTRRIFESRDPRVVTAVRALWEHSRAVALLTQRVATVTGAMDPDTGYLAGLLHDVGKPVVATMLLEAEAQIAQRNPKMWIDSETWISVVQNTHRPIALSMAAKWQLHEDVQKAIDACGDFDPTNRLSVGNAVRFSNAVAKQKGLYVGPLDSIENDALVVVGGSLLGVDDATLNRLIEDLKDKSKETS